MENTITGLDIQLMISHRLKTPYAGYLGSRYGDDTKALLFHPQSDGSADEFIDKLYEDVPILQVLPAGSVNLYGDQVSPDKLNIKLEVSGTIFEIT